MRALPRSYHQSGCSFSAHVYSLLCPKAKSRAAARGASRQACLASSHPRCACVATTSTPLSPKPLADALALYFTVGHVSGALTDPAGGNAAPESCFAGAYGAVVRPARPALSSVWRPLVCSLHGVDGAPPGAHRGGRN